MPWVPKTDFEEEVVNLQPHHDFIYGVLSEPQYTYPRPKSHTEFAANKKLKDKEEESERRAGKFNEKLRVIQQVQRMACTKPLGEQPSIDDWEDNNMIEQETVGMMRYCGMGVSVEQPLDQEVTIATYPVENSVKLLKNGRRKVALFFNDDVFKLKEKVSDSSSGFESCSNSETHKFGNNSLDSELESDYSFNTNSSLSLNSFNTAEECNNDSLSSVSSRIKSPMKNSKGQSLPQYEKLLEDLSFLSLDSYKSSSCDVSQKQNSDSFETADESSFWKPFLEDEDIFSKKENWPVLSKKKTSCDEKNSLDNDDLFNERKSDLTDVASREPRRKRVTRVSFLTRFIKSEDGDAIKTDDNSAEPEPKTYASITKTPKQTEKKESNRIVDSQPFYTTRRMYALKRNVK